MKTTQNKIYLRNVTDELGEPHNFYFEMTEHPITAPNEFSLREGEQTPDGRDQADLIKTMIKRNPAMKDRLSVRYEVNFPAGKTMIFGEGEDLNLEHARYIYRSFGGYAENPDHTEVKQPIIEVVEQEVEKTVIGKDGKEKTTKVKQWVEYRGIGSLHGMFGQKRPVTIGTHQGEYATHKQFMVPESAGDLREAKKE
jgi:hypothetical protein